jgi:phage baseplate assembly protein W
MPSYITTKKENESAYSDIDPSMLVNSKNSDLFVLQNTKAVRRSILNLLLTAYGERLFQPNIGGSLRSLLFEPIDPLTTFEMKDRIINTIRNHEPRVGALVVDVISNPESNSYQVTVEFSLVFGGERDRVTTVLERIR